MSQKEDRQFRKEIYKEALQSIAAKEGPETSREWARRMIDVTASPEEEKSANALMDAIGELSNERPPQRG
jgi:hypothetical protein